MKYLFIILILIPTVTFGAYRGYNTKTKQYNGCAEVRINTDKNTKKCYVYKLNSKNVLTLYVVPNVIVQESTGLYDRHGVLIYEGDTITTSDSEYNGIVMKKDYGFFTRTSEADIDFIEIPADSEEEVSEIVKL